MQGALPLAWIDGVGNMRWVGGWVGGEGAAGCRARCCWCTSLGTTTCGGWVVMGRCGGVWGEAPGALKERPPTMCTCRTLLPSWLR